MSKKNKTALIVSVCLIGLGLILLCISISIGGFSMDWLRQQLRETTYSIDKTMEITDDFTCLRIKHTKCDIEILPSSDDKCRVDYTDCSEFTHSISVEDQTLTITVRDTGSQAGLTILPSSFGAEIKVYLPMDALEDLDISTASGNVRIAENFSFGTADISTASGDLSFSAQVKNGLVIDTASGNVTLSDVNAAALTIGTASGDVELRKVIVSGHMEIGTASGDIELDRVDSETAQFETASGDIEGTILNPKNFSFDTGSGDVELPSSDKSAGRWTFDTASGDVELDIA